MKITCNPLPNQQPDFYIARVGSCAGKPLKTPYTSNNSMAVYSDNAAKDFQRVMAMYKAKRFDPYILGTCQPALRVRYVRDVVNSIPHISDQHLEAMVMLENKIELLELQLKKARELQLAFHQSITR